MEIIALTGTYDAEIQDMLKQLTPAGFQLKLISSANEYDQLADANYVILRILSLGETDIERIPNLKLIQRWGVGFDKVDVKAAGAHNVQVAITPGMNAASVSEMAVLLMLAVYRQLVGLHQNVVAGKWQEGAWGSSSYTLENKRVGLVGLGAIGKLVAKKVQGFGAQVYYYDVFRLPAEEEKKLGLVYLEKEELLKTSDVISLHVPLNEGTRHMIDKAALALMKPTAILINTARGALINEADLVEALQSGEILGAGLDCLEKEPAGTDNPLFWQERVIVTPHMGGSTKDINWAMAKRCMENIVKVSRGILLEKPDLVNAEYLVR
ncbi:2-hydroxyacid dehydrogenase [Anaeroarcus burkinensis]|uniref:2-hydroxyacid dehydrogenase n=1 Tax=Anaeroarcus burkinensis TaxID=82376 RepID=UPI00040E64CF|nr:2-hydroxyacid dehydrogenase [Anaeroarcus burkinensis]